MSSMTERGRELDALVELLKQAGGTVQAFDRWPGWLTEYIGPDWREAIELAKEADLVRVDLVLTMAEAAQ